MTNDNSVSFSPKAQVIVKEILPPDPAVEAAMLELKQIITTDGCANIPEYLEWRDRHGLIDEQILPIIQEAGYGFVKTTAVNQQLEQEVIVDLRYMAATMLLCYSDREFAHHNSVLDAVKAFYSYGNWEGTIGVSIVLMEDTYSTYGHHFSYMEVADNADLSVWRVVQAEFVTRHLHALNELVKDEAELTAVFRLCVDVMHIVNTGQASGKLYRTYRGDGKAYKHFWRMACIIRDRARGCEKQTQKCCGKCGGKCDNHKH